MYVNRFDTMLFDSDGTFSFDGKNWYRGLPDEFLQGDKKGRNPTETGQNHGSRKTKISLVILLVI